MSVVTESSFYLLFLAVCSSQMKSNDQSRKPRNSKSRFSSWKEQLSQTICDSVRLAISSSMIHLIT